MRWEIALFDMVFVTAAVAIFRLNEIALAGVVLLTGAGLLLFGGSPYYGLVAFLIIPIVHVLAFTAAFLLFGALKAAALGVHRGWASRRA